MLDYLATLLLVVSVILIALSSFVAWLGSGERSQRGLRSLAFFLVGLAGLGTTAFLPRGVPGFLALPTLASYGFETACLALLPVFAYHVVGRSVPRGPAAVYGMVWALALPFKVYVSFAAPNPGFKTLIAIVDTTLALASLVVVFRGRSSIQNPTTRRLMTRIIVTIFAFSPVLFYNCIGIPGFSPFADPYQTQAVFFAFLSVMILRESRAWLTSLFLPSRTSTPEHGSGAPLLEGLSLRQREIAEGLLAGESAKEMAVRLGISPKTAENHTYALYRKVGARNRIQFYELFRGRSSVNEPVASESGHRR